MINDDNKSSFKKMLKSNGLYFALGLCLLAAGIIGIGATAGKTPDIKTENENTIINIVQEATTKSEKKDFKLEINIDEFTTDKAAELISEEKSTEKEEAITQAVFDNNAKKIEEKEEKIVYSSPLGLTMGLDFSMGIPVFSQTMKDYRTHNGVDFMGVKGEAVNTIAPGTVTSVKNDNLWGNTVTIDHGNGITSCIMGLSDEGIVTVGTKLYEKTIIGTVGSIPIENEEGSHIHLEVRKNGALIDPLEILGLAGD